MTIKFLKLLDSSQNNRDIFQDRYWCTIFLKDHYLLCFDVPEVNSDEGYLVMMSSGKLFNYLGKHRFHENYE